MRSRLLARHENGSVPVLEALIVGVLVVGSVLFVATWTTPSTTQTGARASLQSSSGDALLVLGEFPATDPEGHEHLLEELVTSALAGDCTDLARRLNGYFAPAVGYDVHLENGHGGRIPVCARGEPGGERTVSAAVIQPRWSSVFALPNVTHVAGTATLDEIGDIVTLESMGVHGFVVRNSYLDEVTPASLVFENGHHAAFPPSSGARYASPVPPEHVSVAGHSDGYAVPYRTNGSWQEYEQSALNTTQPPATFLVGHDLAFGSAVTARYVVHPAYSASSAISNAVLVMDAGDRVRPDSRQKEMESSVTFTWDYGLVTSAVAQVAFQDGTLTVYDPLGRVWNGSSVAGVAGSATFPIGRDVLWGTYVAHLKLDLEERDAAGVPTGTVYAVNQLTYFNVNPPGWATLPDRIPPVYRVVLSAGFADW